VTEVSLKFDDMVPRMLENLDFLRLRLTSGAAIWGDLHNQRTPTIALNHGSVLCNSTSYMYYFFIHHTNVDSILCNPRVPRTSYRHPLPHRPSNEPGPLLLNPDLFSRQIRQPDNRRKRQSNGSIMKRSYGL
jgi:hypothetical protein